MSQNITQNLKSLVLSTTLIAAFTAPALAEKTEGNSEAHVRKVEKRLERQAKRIDAGLKKGKLTPEQAQELKSKDEAVKAKLEADAKDGLNKQEFKQLNQDLNGVSKEIHDQKQEKK